MIFHTYLTDGYFEWAKLLIKSLKKTNGEDKAFVIVSSRNLKSEQCDELESLYKDLRVFNQNLDFDEMAKRAKVDKKTLLRYKKKVENVSVDKESKVWKLMIAAEDRLKEIQSILNLYSQPMLHVDVDTYVNGDITPILKTVRNNDFTTRWRFEKQIKRDGYVKYENRATLISVQGYNASSCSRVFLNRWIEHLCKVPASERPTGYGQTSCYRAYLDFKDDRVFQFGDVPPEFLSPQGFGKGILWGANKGAKSETLKVYQKHFRENL